MQKRPFGQTEEMISIIGFGGILVTNTYWSIAKITITITVIIKEISRAMVHI